MPCPISPGVCLAFQHHKSIPSALDPVDFSRGDVVRDYIHRLWGEPSEFEFQLFYLPAVWPWVSYQVLWAFLCDIDCTASYMHFKMYITQGTEPRIEVPCNDGGEVISLWRYSRPVEIPWARIWSGGSTSL